MMCIGNHTQAAAATAHTSPTIRHGHAFVSTFVSSNTCVMNASLPLNLLALPRDLVDDQRMRSVADIVLAGDRYMLARKWHQFRVLRRGWRLAVDRQEDRAIVPKDDQRRAVFRA